MKKYSVGIDETEESSPMSLFDLFILSDHISETWTREAFRYISSDLTFDERLHSVLKKKVAEQDLYTNEIFQKTLKPFFFVDGAIRINQADIEELNKSMILFSRDSEGHTEAVENTEEYESYTDSLIRDFAYQRNNEIIFRNPKYYFLLDGLTVDIGTQTTSINNYVICDVKIEDFVPEIAAQYNSIHQHLGLFSHFYFSQLYTNLVSAKEPFCQELTSALSPERLDKLREVMSKGLIPMGSAELDAIYFDQWRNTISILERLSEFVSTFNLDPTVQTFGKIVRLLSKHGIAIEHAKMEFGINIDDIFNKYFNGRPSQAVKKILLGLLDAKINMLAFSQNVAQIFTSEQFLNVDYIGSLIFNQSEVRHMKSVCPKQFSDVKTLQKELRSEDLNIKLLRKMDEAVGSYTDALLDDNGIGIVKLLAAIDSSLPELTDKPYYSVPPDIEGPLSALLVFFQMIEVYVASCDATQEHKAKKKAAEGKRYKKSEAHLNAKKSALNRIIRIYREENDPIVMIKTAQNSLNYIIQKGFIVTKDILHLMSVNYGGSLVGSFAKHIYGRTVRKGQILINPGNVIYSIYDVRNANEFSRLIDYPFSRILRDTQISSDIKARFSKRNWLLVFDDNTNSGQTLDDIRILAEASGFYGRVDLFPCRASIEFRNYRKTLPDETKLSMLICCGVIARKSKVNSEGNRYKETIGSIIGHRLYKILTT